jgi:RNA polymerase sigma-70 factor (ECF subfamily)
VNEDTLLIERALAGDSDAFGHLVRRYQDRLFNTLMHVIGNREEAEDVVQDAFTQAYANLNRFERRANFYTWLYRIAFNLSVSRRRRRRPQAVADVEQVRRGGDTEDPHDLPLQQLERQERIDLIRKALNSLNEEARTILVLREMDGCCYEAIADLLDVPVGTVRSRLHRARLQLKRYLDEVLREQS